MRLILLIAVILLAIDALYFDGAYTQAAYREVSSAAARLVDWADNEVNTRASEPRPAPAPPGTAQ